MLHWQIVFVGVNFNVMPLIFTPLNAKRCNTFFMLNNSNSMNNAIFFIIQPFPIKNLFIRWLNSNKKAKKRRDFVIIFTNIKIATLYILLNKLTFWLAISPLRGVPGISHKHSLWSLNLFQLLFLYSF